MKFFSRILRNVTHRRKLRLGRIAEERLWNRIRDGRLGGYQFSRGAVIGTTSVTFACTKPKVAVVISHAPKMTTPMLVRQEVTARSLMDMEYAVLGFDCHIVNDNFDYVAASILDACRGMEREENGGAIEDLDDFDDEDFEIA